MFNLMAKTFIGVREVDEDAFRRLRALAIAKRLKLGEALTRAINKFVEEEKLKEKGKKLDPKNLMKISGIIKTKGKVRWSEEIDEILYGE